MNSFGYCVYHLNKNLTKFNLIFTSFYSDKRRLPWDQTTPWGYFGETLYHLFVGEMYLLTNGAFLLLFISLCLHHRAFYQMFDNFVRKMDYPDENRNDTRHVWKLIKFHNTFIE